MYLYFCLHNNNNPMYIQELRVKIPPHIQNTIRVCNQNTLLILYYIISWLVTLPKLTNVYVQVSDNLVLTVGFNIIKYSFQISFSLLPEMSNRSTDYSFQNICFSLV